MINTTWTHHKVMIISMIAIVTGELLIFIGNGTAGMAVHVINLQMILISMFTPGEKADQVVLDKQILQALLLVLELRIINMSMPFFFTMTLYWYPLVYSPLFISIYLILRNQDISLDEIGVTAKNLYFYFCLAIPVALGLALVEYHIIHPDPLIPNLGITNFITLTIIMIMFVALVEELVFRSILQTRLQQSMDNWNGLLVASILFGVMHSGYGLVHEVAFMTVAGLIIGYAYQKTGSLPFVVMVHGMINILLFGLLPYTL